MSFTGRRRGGHGRGRRLLIYCQDLFGEEQQEPVARADPKQAGAKDDKANPGERIQRATVQNDPLAVHQRGHAGGVGLPKLERTRGHDDDAGGDTSFGCAAKRLQRLFPNPPLSHVIQDFHGVGFRRYLTVVLTRLNDDRWEARRAEAAAVRPESTIIGQTPFELASELAAQTEC